MAVGTDAPSWTFGLNSKTAVPLVPGPGTYDVARELLADGVGTHFGRVGDKPTRAQTDTRRLIFDGEKEGIMKPGPGVYSTQGSQTPTQGKIYPPDRMDHTPRFPHRNQATDAGPGSYVPPDFAGKGPAYSITSRSSTSLKRPESPGPGQYIRVQLSASKEESKEMPEGFGRRNSPRFDEHSVDNPGPGAYQSSHFQPRIAKDITLGRLIRPAGWSAKIRELARVSCAREELDRHEGSEKKRRFLSSRNVSPTHRRRPSSAPPSSRLLRACARGRRHPNSNHNGRKFGRGGSAHATAERPLAHVIKEAGRRRKAQVTARVKGCVPRSAGSRLATTGRGGAHSSSTAAVFDTAPQRPCDVRMVPGPGSYYPRTLDEAERAWKIIRIGGKSGRELFRRPPDTPGPEKYSPEVMQRRLIDRCKPVGLAPPGQKLADDGRVIDPTVTQRTSAGKLTATSSPALSSPPIGTFGLSERFVRDPEIARKPGVGEYDLRAAEQAAGGCGVALHVSLGRRDPPNAPPYDPYLGRYVRMDASSTPSPHNYRPEVSAGGGECGVGGHAPAPPAWSFGAKRRDPKPPAGPGPGTFTPMYEPSPPASKFGMGRAVTPSHVSRVPWEENVERLARGEGGGVDAKLYIPNRTRFGAKAYMSSRHVPVPRFRRRSQRTEVGF